MNLMSTKTLLILVLGKKVCFSILPERIYPYGKVENFKSVPRVVSR